MEKNKFFGFLWRANAVFIFGAGLAAVFVLISAAWILISEIGGYEKSPPPISGKKVEVNQPDENLWVKIPSSSFNVEGYTYFELRAGTDSYGKSLSSSSSYSRSQIRNIAVYNLVSDETRWMFEGSQQQIEEYKPVRKEFVDSLGETKTPVKAILITKSTRNSDETINRELWIMSPNGENLRRLLPQISKAPEIEYFGETVKLIVKADKNFVVYPLHVDELAIGEAVNIPMP